MLNRLTKLAARSAQLRNAALLKQAGILGSVAKGVGQWAVNNPGKALFGAMGTAGAATATKGKYRQFKSGFDPAVQQVMMGNVPMPPGAG
jgi:hypothetical protein